MGRDHSPLLKPNKPANSMASFRPATLTSTLCKLMERIVARRVRDCIEDKLQPQQAGFRPARSTLDTLMQVMRHVRRRKDGEKTVAVFIGHALAFDSVDHGCIVKELLSFGVEKHLVAWIAGLLKGRTAKVRFTTCCQRISASPVVSLKGRCWDHCCSLSRWIR
ncbi:putative Reverse transcriptase (RNA dependent DNA polymerase) [Trypanosoma vivax]|nr:putative Reverse transcriptase (RNA dependent DNA polymerase) [Trypanosoma vivax]